MASILGWLRIGPAFGAAVSVIQEARRLEMAVQALLDAAKTTGQVTDALANLNTEWQHFGMALAALRQAIRL